MHACWIMLMNGRGCHSTVVILRLKQAGFLFLNEKKSKGRKTNTLRKELREISLWVGACFFSPLWTAISMNTVSPPSRVHSSCSLKRLWMLTWEVVTL